MSSSSPPADQAPPESKTEEEEPPPPEPADDEETSTAAPSEGGASSQGEETPSKKMLNPKAAAFTPATPSPKRRATTSTSAQTDPTTPRNARGPHPAAVKTPPSGTPVQPPQQKEQPAATDATSGGPAAPPPPAEAEVKQEEGKAPTPEPQSAAAPAAPTAGQVKEFDNEAVLQNLIRAQIDFFFSDYHLTNDTYLLARMSEDPQHWVGVDLLAKMPRIRQLTNKRERVQQALAMSEYLELSADQTKVRRPSYALPRPKPNRDLRRTVFLYGIPPNKGEDELRGLLSTFGEIKKVQFDALPDPSKQKETKDENGAAGGGGGGGEEETGDTPIREVALLIMQKKFLHPRLSHDGDDEQRDPKKYQMMASLYAHPVRNPNGDAQDFSHLRSSFVVFESQSQATKCVKARVRAVDGMRAPRSHAMNGRGPPPRQSRHAIREQQRRLARRQLAHASVVERDAAAPHLAHADADRRPRADDAVADPAVPDVGGHRGHAAAGQLAAARGVPQPLAARLLRRPRRRRARPWVPARRPPGAAPVGGQQARVH